VRVTLRHDGGQDPDGARCRLKLYRRPNAARRRHRGEAAPSLGLRAGSHAHPRPRRSSPLTLTENGIPGSTFSGWTLGTTRGPATLECRCVTITREAISDQVRLAFLTSQRRDRHARSPRQPGPGPASGRSKCGVDLYLVERDRQGRGAKASRSGSTFASWAAQTRRPGHPVQRDDWPVQRRRDRTSFKTAKLTVVRDGTGKVAPATVRVHLEHRHQRAGSIAVCRRVHQQQGTPRATCLRFTAGPTPIGIHL